MIHYYAAIFFFCFFPPDNAAIKTRVVTYLPFIFSVFNFN